MSQHITTAADAATVITSKYMAGQEWSRCNLRDPAQATELLRGKPAPKYVGQMYHSRMSSHDVWWALVPPDAQEGDTIATHIIDSYSDSPTMRILAVSPTPVRAALPFAGGSPDRRKSESDARVAIVVIRDR